MSEGSKALSETEVSVCVPQPQARKYVAVASTSREQVDLHLGETRTFHIYSRVGATYEWVESRPAPPRDSGVGRWLAVARLLEDCSALLVCHLGQTPLLVLSHSGLSIYQTEQKLAECLPWAFQGTPPGSVPRRATCPGRPKESE